MATNIKTNSTEQVLRTVYAAFNARDVDTVPRLYASGCGLAERDGRRTAFMATTAYENTGPGNGKPWTRRFSRLVLLLTTRGALWLK